VKKHSQFIGYPIVLKVCCAHSCHKGYRPWPQNNWTELWSRVGPSALTSKDFSSEIGILQSFKDFFKEFHF
jgi:hypothetical protein